MRRTPVEELARAAGRTDEPGAVVFDLDGTVADSQEGILVCLRQTLREFARRDDDVHLRGLIGPPLDESFAELGFTGVERDAAVARYRVLYDQVGVDLAKPYHGVVDVLEVLHERGVPLALATAKRVDFAERMLRAFGVRDLFGWVAGASLDNTLSAKVDIVAEVRPAFEGRPGTSWMVGDRRHDVEAALALGLLPVGVLWGYGSRDELVGAGARWLVSRPSQLLDARGDGPPVDGPP